MFVVRAVICVHLGSMQVIKREDDGTAGTVAWVGSFVVSGLPPLLYRYYILIKFREHLVPRMSKFPYLPGIFSP